MLLNGGPHFKINPSVSFFFVCEKEGDIDRLWKNLTEDGAILMALDKYEWSEKYGWVQDKYGVNWQLIFGKPGEIGQKVTPAMMFTGNQHGKAESAMEFYTTVFSDSGIKSISRYTSKDNDLEGTIKHAQFIMGNKLFIAMDSSHAHQFGFNEAISFVVDCETQEEIDYYWNQLTLGGEESQCGWLKDRFGFSWQIVPSILAALMTDPSRSERVVNAFLKMKKFDIKILLEA